MVIQDQSRLVRLSRVIRALEDKAVSNCEKGFGRVSTGWGPVDQVLVGGLAVGAIHEFCGPLPPSAGGPCGLADDSPEVAQASRLWAQPRRLCYHSRKNGFAICVLVHLVRQAAATAKGQVLWIGRRCWPNPLLLAQSRLLDRSLFVDAGQKDIRLWSIELAMRCPAVAAVVGDACGFDVPATRRLQLAARQSQALVLLARSGSEIRAPSAASTRWAVYRRLSDSTHPAWTLELLRCKGRQLAQDGRWPLEWDCGSFSVIVPAAMVAGPAAAETAWR